MSAPPGASTHPPSQGPGDPWVPVRPQTSTNTEKSVGGGKRWLPEGPGNNPLEEEANGNRDEVSMSARRTREDNAKQEKT